MPDRMGTDVFLQRQLLHIFIQNPTDTPVCQNAAPVIDKHILMLRMISSTHDRAAP